MAKGSYVFQQKCCFVERHSMHFYSTHKRLRDTYWVEDILIKSLPVGALRFALYFIYLSICRLGKWNQHHRQPAMGKITLQQYIFWHFFGPNKSIFGQKSTF